MSTTPAPEYGWIQALPKICLHDHLDGGVQPATMIEIAQEIGYELPESTPEKLQQRFEEAADSRSLERYLETFDHTLAVMQRAEDLRRIAREHVMTLAADGVIYGEVRWAPEQHTNAGLSMDEAVVAVTEGLTDGMESIADTGAQVIVNQIICAMRQNDRSLEVAKLAVKHRRAGVVGFDLAGPEDGFSPAKHREALDYVAENFMPVTLHSGEAAGIDSIRSALLDGRALRLGHGVRITEDFTYSTVKEVDPDGIYMPGADPNQEVLNLGQVSSWTKDRRITLEVCPCSNLQTDAAYSVHSDKSENTQWAHTIEEHPVVLLRDLGFAVTINPDNRLMSGTSITHEFTELAKVHGYGPNEFFELTMNAIEGAFIALNEKQTLMRTAQAMYQQIMQPAGEHTHEHHEA